MECKNLDVFVLTYNRSEYLKVMLQSLCNQTATGFNIIVLNNASTDNTQDVVNEFIKKYPQRNITLITNETNIGNPANFEKSRQLAKNEYTAVFHDDDVIHPEYIEYAMKLFASHPDAVLCGGEMAALWNVSNDNFLLLGNSYYVYPKEEGVYLNLLFKRPSFPSYIYKTEAYKKVEYHFDKYGKICDIILVYEISKLGDILFMLDYCIRYRVHPAMDSNNLSTGPFPDEVINILKRIQELNTGHKLCVQYLLYNFANYLYNWCALYNHISLHDFFRKLRKEAKVFSKFELYCYRVPFINSCIRWFVGRDIKLYTKKVRNAFQKRF